MVPTGPVDVYAQVFKTGVTDAVGQGADISAVLYYTTDIAAQVAAPMVFLADNGASNDEYTGQTPQAALLGAAWVDVTAIFTDATDASDFEVVGDQNSNPPQMGLEEAGSSEEEPKSRLGRAAAATTGRRWTSRPTRRVIPGTEPRSETNGRQETAGSGRRSDSIR